MAIKHYDAMGISHDLQRDITELMHRLTMAAGQFTLSELGYLHMSTLLYNLQTQSLELKIYFDIRLAARRDRDRMIDGLHIVPVGQLNLFSGYFFVGDVSSVVTYEKVMAPKVDVVEDAMGRASLEFRNKSSVKELDVLVLNCSFPLAMAAVANISLNDPAYKPKVKIIAKAEEAAMKSVVSNVKQKVVPVIVDLEYTEGFGTYDHDDAINYLQRMHKEAGQASRNHEKIVQSVEKRTKKAKKKADASSKWMNKFS